MTGSGEEDLERLAWYGANSGDQLHPVGEKEANAWGLYDVLGNVWEWVEDDWHRSYKGAPVDGSAWVKKRRGDTRVVRGGSFNNVARYLRAAFRFDVHSEFRVLDYGFRVAWSRSGGQQ